jgi:soluble lytic murein transglycosylase-like protein
MHPKIESLIRAKALEYGVDPDIAVKIAIVESGGNPNAVSSTGAIGIFQFTGDTANRMGLVTGLT